MTFGRHFLPILFASSCLMAGAAYADPINTGVDPVTGTLIAPGGVDGAWTGVDVSGAAVPVTAFAVSGYGPYWLNSASAAFISPTAAASGQADNYPNPNSAANGSAFINWTQNFTLTANGAASDILGQFAVDNALLGIIINGTTLNVVPGSFNVLTGFDIPTADLLVGSNTITFETENFAGANGNPTGLLVQFTQVPEPASVAAFGAGLMALMMGVRRRRA